MNSYIVDITLLALLALSIITWSVGVVKYLSIKKERIASARFEAAFKQSRTWEGVVNATRTASLPDSDLAELARTGVATCAELSGFDHNRHALDSLRELLDRALMQRVAQIARTRERGLSVLASIGSTAPFVGLFGTVWGIMNALIGISAAGQASIDVVACPIGEALIATAVGIVTAIPAVMIYNYYVRQMRVRVTELEAFNEDFLRLAMKNEALWGKS